MASDRHKDDTKNVAEVEKEESKESKTTLNEETLVSHKDSEKSQNEAQADEAIPGPSKPFVKVEESLNPYKEQRARKRERCEDDTEDLKRYEDEGQQAKAGREDTEERPSCPAVAGGHEEATSHSDTAEVERHEDNVTSGSAREVTEERNHPFPQLRMRTSQRRYRRRLNRSSSSSSSSSHLTVSNSSSSSDERQPEDSVDSDSTDSIENRIIDALNQSVRASAMTLDSDDTWSLLDSDDSDSDSDAENRGKEETSEENTKKLPKCLTKEIPKHKWSVTKSVFNRQLGMHTRQQEPQLFRQHCYGSLHCVKRLELMYKLDEHRGCVNAISFNQSGNRLASGSDDKKIIVWDWAIGKKLVTYSSGHSSNVFQAKFLPMCGDNHIVSSARDGQVRLAVLSSTGECRVTRRLANHRKPVNKLSLLPETPHVILSAGEDGRVMAIDVRAVKQSTLVTVKDDHRKIGLYSVDTHPLNSNEFCVCGVDYYIRIYDKRKIDVDGTPMKKFCPSHIVGTNKYTNVTCALYNHDGTEILGSYNDENLYLFDTRHSDGADFVHKYEGHRNSTTVKSCDFFGPNSEYIMSGSDCGNIFFWDKNTEAIVQFMRGDEKGVVNALVGHPEFPILATSGLDSDVKIWVPSCEQDPEMKDLRRVVTKNIRDRVNDQPYRVDVFESHLNMDLERQFGVTLGSFPVRVRAHFPGADGSSSSDGDSDDGYPNPLQCPTS